MQKRHMVKRDRTLIRNTSDEVDPPKKRNKLSRLFSETRTGLNVVDSDGVTATLCGAPLASGDGEHTPPLSPLSMAEQDADEESLAEENILAGSRGAKRTCALKENTCAEDAPRKKVKKRDDAINKEVPTTAPLPMFAEGGTPQPKRELRKRPSEDPSAFETPVKARVRKQSRAFKCMADAETEAHGSKPDCSLATATGHGSKPATSSTVTSTTFTRDAPAKRNQKKEQEAEEEDEELQAELLCAQAHLQKCLTNEDYTGAVAAKEIDDALTETLARAAPAKRN